MPPMSEARVGASAYSWDVNSDLSALNAMAGPVPEIHTRRSGHEPTLHGTTREPSDAEPSEGMEGSDQLERGRAAFNCGDYFAAHELWEDVWQGLVGGERTFLQGLIQIAAGLHHLQQHRPQPAVSLLRKGLEKLSRSPQPPNIHLRVDPLISYLTRLLAELAVPAAGASVNTIFKL